MNPFTGVYQTSFKCEKCQTGPIDKNDKRDTLSIWWTSPTVEECIQKYFESEIIPEYPCFRCSLQRTMEGYNDQFDEEKEEDLKSNMML